MTLRTAALLVWDNQLGIQYRWGGDDPIAGWDCSGFVQEGLRAVGLCDPKIDYSAHELLWTRFKDYQHLSKDKLRPGCILFWENLETKKIYHTEVVWQVIGNTVLTIGASGGTSGTVDEAQAITQNAYVKIRPRDNWHYAVEPFND